MLNTHAHAHTHTHIHICSERQEQANTLHTCWDPYAHTNTFCQRGFSSTQGQSGDTSSWAKWSKSSTEKRRERGEIEGWMERNDRVIWRRLSWVICQQGDQHLVLDFSSGKCRGTDRKWGDGGNEVSSLVQVQTPLDTFLSRSLASFMCCSYLCQLLQ